MSLFFPLIPPRFEVALVDCRSKSERVRMNAVRTLVRPPEGKEQAAIDALRGLIEDPYPPVRSAVLAALGEHGDASSLDALIDAIDDPVSEVREIALIAIAKLGDPRAIPALRRALRSDHPEVRFQAAESLAELAPEETEGAITPLLKDPDALVRANAACALSKANATTARDAIATLLSDPVIRTRYEAAVALGHLGDRRAVPILRESLRDDSYTFLAIELLADLDAREAIPDLARIAGSFFGSRAVKAAARDALQRLEEAHAKDDDNPE